LEAAVSFRQIRSLKFRSPGQQGFTLAEVLVSMFVLTTGLISMAGVFSLAMATTQTSQLDLTAKQMASETMESIFTARQTTAIPWSGIQNTGAGGIFLPGFNPIYLAGTDGLIGTADDSAAGLRTVTLPGPDGVVGTSDDITMPLTNFQRKIDITTVADANGNVATDLRSLTITIQYNVPQTAVKKNYILTSYISQYR
jgi:prepilin-type N-terminal cleavage/methylation domain-containing protein